MQDGIGGLFLRQFGRISPPAAVAVWPKIPPARPKPLAKEGTEILNFDNFKFFFSGKFFQFKDLGLNAQNLSIIFFGALANVKYVFHNGFN